MDRKRYRKRENQFVVGVQLDLETDGFVYNKWGTEQRCRAGDWLVNNIGECYTIEKETFSRTYREIAPGQYVKTVPVWAKQAIEAGVVSTTEGSTAYAAGDYVVSNHSDGKDSYAVSQEKFETMYALDP